MRHSPILFISMLFVTMMFASRLKGQSWEFIKEKDGIKLYTREEAGKPVKAFRGVTDINAPAEKIFALLKDMNNTDWWDKNLTLVKVLHYEKSKGARYYLVYDLPWPITDRDLCVDVAVTSDELSGESGISVVSINGIIPERDDMIRIKDYRETWTVKSADGEMTHVVLEGFIDPAGNVPDWISNILITDSPFKTISGLRSRIMAAD